MVAQPVAGYPSKKAACFAMIREGKSDAEILVATGTTPGTLSVYRDNMRGKRVRKAYPSKGHGRPSTRKRAHGALTLEQRMKAERILAAALPVLAEGIGCTPEHLVAFIKYYPILFRQSPTAEAGEIRPPVSPAKISASAPIPEQPDGVASGANTAPPISNPEQPMIVFRNKNTVAMDEKVSSGMVTLKAEDGQYLNLDGTGKIRDKAYAYRGTPSQALKMRRASVAATGMKMVRFETPRGK
jgi:hypothetical protein